MTTVSLILVLISAAMHVSWNLMCKSRKPSGAFFLIATTASIILLLPVMIYLSSTLTQIPRSVWWLLLITSVFQALYYIALGNAYRVCEVSVAYPVARALPVLFVPVVMLTLSIGGILTIMAIIGMILVAFGCMILPVTSNLKSMIKEVFSKGYLFIFLAAVGTTGYTIIDSEALRQLTEASNIFTHSKTALIYISLETLCIEVFLIVYVLLHRQERETLKELIKSRVWQPMFSGIICTASYTLILAAMMFASNVSYIAAFRQVSIPLGAILGILIFKEKTSYPKFIGILLIFAGLVLVALY